LIDLKQTHQGFLAALDKSQQSVCAVAMYLTRLGQTVQINGLHKAPTAEQRDTFRDLGDLHILKRVEVKQRTIDWTCREDYPFPDMLVTGKSSFDHAVRYGGKPTGFIILNRAGTHAAMISSRTQGRWEVRRVPHPRGTEAETYVAPLDVPRWVSLVEILTEINGE
jgi:hypothetical protein